MDEENEVKVVMRMTFSQTTEAAMGLLLIPWLYVELAVNSHSVRLW